MGFAAVGIIAIAVVIVIVLLLAFNLVNAFLPEFMLCWLLSLQSLRLEYNVDGVSFQKQRLLYPFFGARSE